MKRLIFYTLLLVISAFAFADESSKLYKQCAKSKARAAYYDCTCIANMEDELRAHAGKGFMTARRKEKIADVEEQIATYEALKAKSDNAARIKSFDNQIAKHERRIVQLNTPPDPSSYSSKFLMRYFDENNACRSEENTKEYIFNRCMASKRNLEQEVATKQCNCTADKIADEWLDPDKDGKTSRMTQPYQIAIGECSQQFK